MTRLLLALVSVLTSGVACGIPPSEVLDKGEPPIVTAQPSVAGVFLLKEGQLLLWSVPAESRSAEAAMRGLFKVKSSPTGLETALEGLTLEVARQEDRNLEVRVKGEPSELAIAQITCTGRHQPTVWTVGIEVAGAKGVRRISDRPCSDFSKYAYPGTELPP